jgi:ribonucleoside-diphosphate reductase beta chain
MSIFSARQAFKPFEYPEVTKYRDAIHHSFWIVSEWNFGSDIQDFRVRLDDVERNAIKNALLAISQIEVSVKRFWAKIGDRFPKAEFEEVGAVFADSEVRHQSAYSKLLEILDLNDEFDILLENPVIQGRVDYLTKYLKGASENCNQNYTLSLALFSIFIENVSLFSQFLVIKSFNKYKNVLKDVDNVVQSTAMEERVHNLFGVYLLKQIKNEFPDWFNEDFYKKIERAAKKAYDAESAIIDWIFEKGELSFISRESVKNFTRDRFNKSMIDIGGQNIFEVDTELLATLKWFDEEIDGLINVDFFHKKSNAYFKNSKSITAEDLF